VKSQPRSVPHSGSHLVERHVADLTLTVVRYAQRTKLPQHAHDRACFCLILSGHYDEVFGPRTVHCNPSTVLFRPAQEPHCNTFNDDESKCLLIEVEAAWLERVREYTKLLDEPVKRDGGLPARTALAVFRQCDSRDDLSSLAIEGLALELAAEFAKNLKNATTSKPPRWLHQAREFIDVSYMKRLTLTEIGAQVGVHPVHVAREFRRHFGHTVGGYVRQQRVERACLELKVDGKPITEIALLVGFSDQSHLTRAFKRLKATTPASYRRSLLHRR
jgi:AraC family transcriptional regulator